MTTTNTVLLKFGAIGVLKQADTMPRPPGVSIELGQGDDYLMMTANPALGHILCANAQTTNRQWHAAYSYFNGLCINDELIRTGHALPWNGIGIKPV